MSFFVDNARANHLRRCNCEVHRKNMLDGDRELHSSMGHAKDSTREFEEVLHLWFGCLVAAINAHAVSVA